MLELGVRVSSNRTGSRLGPASFLSLLANRQHLPRPKTACRQPHAYHSVVTRTTAVGQHTSERPPNILSELGPDASAVISTSLLGKWQFAVDNG